MASREEDLRNAAAAFVKAAADVAAPAGAGADPLDDVTFHVPDLGDLDPVVTDGDVAAIAERMATARAPAEAVPALVSLARQVAAAFGLAL